MNRQTSIALVIVILVLLALGCSFSATPVPTTDDSQIHTEVAGTLLAQMTNTQDIPTPTPETETTPTPTTQTEPSQTPTITLSPTSSTPMVSVSVNTNCRTGPSTVYEIVGALLVGEEAQIVGKDESGHYWIIENPDRSGNCWLWGEYATVTGDVSDLPVYTPPPTPTPSPTPTPAIDFIATYENFHDCGGAEHMTFYIGDTGPSRLESANVTVVESSSSTVLFEGYTDVPFVGTALGCPPELHYIGPGAVAFIAVPLSGVPNPGGHQATIKICTQDGLGGACLTKVVNFTIPSP